MYQGTRDWTLHRPEEHTAGDHGISVGLGETDDNGLIARIADAYQRALATSLGSKGSFWLETFEEVKQPIHQALVDRNDSLAALLRDPSSNMLFRGFDPLVKGGAGAPARVVYDNLLTVAEAVGASRLEHPEAYDFSKDPPEPPAVEKILSSLDHHFGFRVSFPNPYPNEGGLATSRGIASRRAVHALYQAWRAYQLASPSGRVLEIGAGLGRTGFYSRQFGIKDYTIIDIPMTIVAQSYFLGRVLGPEHISLYGESLQDGSIKSLPPNAFFQNHDRYDLILNIDSLTEMALSTARDYWRAISSRAAVFLSVNHEYNSFTVREIVKATPEVKATPKTVSRFPYWMRRGYVEEIIEF